ncbi:hypothetical protein Peur_031797 [Populus x canadensis]
MTPEAAIKIRQDLHPRPREEDHPGVTELWTRLHIYVYYTLLDDHVIIVGHEFLKFT